MFTREDHIKNDIKNAARLCRMRVGAGSGAILGRSAHGYHAKEAHGQECLEGI